MHRATALDRNIKLAQGTVRDFVLCRVLSNCAWGPSISKTRPAGKTLDTTSSSTAETSFSPGLCCFNGRDNPSQRVQHQRRGYSSSLTCTKQYTQAKQVCEI